MAATLSAVGHVPVAGLALILGIDRFMSEARALTNMIGNGVATIVVAKWTNDLDVTKLHQQLDIGSPSGTPELDTAPVVPSATRCRSGGGARLVSHEGIPTMSDALKSEYAPPRIWQWTRPSGGRFANINRPVAGATHDAELPVGKHPFQLYSLGTPNGMKVSIMLEELLAAGFQGAEYDAWIIQINKGEQFGSGFVDINPNSKIPALVDRSGSKPFAVFESGAMLVHLAEKFGAFLPKDVEARARCLSWLFWQMGSAPFLGGGFGHFYAYAPIKLEYAIDRYSMEVKRQLDVLDRRLSSSEFIAGNEYTIADMAIWPWYGLLVQGKLYGAGEFLQVHDYKSVVRWSETVARRPAVVRGRKVNGVFGEPSEQLRERHDASDFELRTQDKIGERS